MDWPILSVLGDEDRRRVLAAARRRRFGRDEVIFHEGEPGDTLHLIASGHVAVRVTTPLGDVATVRVLRGGEFFGELAVVAPAPRNATAVAVEGAETLAIHRDDFFALRDRHPAVERMLVEALVGEVRRLADNLLDALYVPVDKRVYRRLAELEAVFAPRNGDGTGNGSASRNGDPPVTIPLTQEHLAQVVGTTRPTMNRLLREAESAGIVRLSRGRVEVTDSAGLARRAR